MLPRAATCCGSVILPETWHSRLGHISCSILHSLASSGVLGHLDVNKVDCQSCQLAKFHALPFNNYDSISQAAFNLVYYDIWGLAPNATMGGSHYFVIFVDDFSQYTWIYLIKNLYELPHKFAITLLPWFAVNSLPQLRSFGQTMHKNIKR